MDYLLFRLYGPMASWGDIAVGEMRPSLAKPTRSALLGLLGAALGLERQDERQQVLSQGYRFAVKLPQTGSLMRDYHTAQAPDSAGKFRYRTRRDELVIGRARLGTVLSSREYLTDAQALVAVQAEPEAPWSLQQLADALQRPRFHLYLGRKSCPLGAPLAPQVEQAHGFRAALDGYQPGGLSRLESRQQARWLPESQQPGYYWEGRVEDFDTPGERFDPNTVQQLTRHDQPLSRQRWQFATRQEYYWLATKEMG